MIQANKLTPRHLLTSLTLALTAAASLAATKPNVVMLLADDLGY